MSVNNQLAGIPLQVFLNFTRALCDYDDDEVVTILSNSIVVVTDCGEGEVLEEISFGNLPQRLRTFQRTGRCR